MVGPTAAPTRSGPGPGLRPARPGPRSSRGQLGLGAHPRPLALGLRELGKRALLRLAVPVPSRLGDLPDQRG
ncbi:TPA: hypothetical protein EYP84_00565 [Candidatus Bipolaricaulota bacterium]|nr:hypothetical protein [Candidatus Bipolaricaulota bacterium]